MLTPKQIEARKNARVRVVPELIALLDSEFEGNPDAEDLLLEAVIAWVRRRRPTPPATGRPRWNMEPMTDAQAKAFGASKMPFGMHNGRRVDEVPIDYLERVADPNEFQRALRRYLNSPRIKAERE